MKDLYLIAGISRQAVQQAKGRLCKRIQQQNEFFELADRIRKDHPRAGCRKMARELRCRGWGRDKLEDLLLSKGYRVVYRRRYIKTTQRQSLYHYPNLIRGLQIDDINQVVQTDITYYRVNNRFYFLTFLQDVYSRKIVGYAVSETLEATANVKALQMMLNHRKSRNVAKLIHHSDKGSQYICGPYIKLLKSNDIKISMCDQAWENAYAERINRTIKEEYLDGWQINSYQQLKVKVKRAVRHYNQARQHQSLNWNTPVNFENKIKITGGKNREKLIIY
jgi:putative transposase